MTDAERAKFEKHLELLCAKWNLPVTPARRESYWRALRGDLPLSAFIGAIDLLLSQSGDFPTADQIRKAGLELAQGMGPQTPDHLVTKAAQLQFRPQRPDESAAQYATQLRLFEYNRPRPVIGRTTTMANWEAEFEARFGRLP